MRVFLFGILAVFFCSPLAFANEKLQNFGVRGGVGTDISGGIAYGVALNYYFPLLDSSGKSNGGFEPGIVLFGGSFDETTEEGIHTYHESTSVLAFGLMMNYLYNYERNREGMFFIAGLGFASISAEWEESSPTDTSLGTPTADGGSMQSQDGSGAGSVVEFGFGYNIKPGMEVRLEVPVIFPFSQEEGAGMIPTFLVTAGYRF